MDPSIATAADYADAMLTARRAKNGLVLLLLLMLLVQLAFFFVLRYSDVISIGPTTATTQAASSKETIIHYFGAGCMFLAVIMSITLMMVLLLIVNIMLVGRLIGVARVTSAYIWCMLLLLLLFPWQAFLNGVGLTPDQAPFKLPGVLFTWEELRSAKFPSDAFSRDVVMKWARFVFWPMVAVIMLLVIQVKSNRGIRQALGEDESISIDQPSFGQPRS